MVKQHSSQPTDQDLADFSAASTAAVMGESRRPNILLGVTGSVAAIKTAELVARLLDFANVKVVVTAAGKEFMKEEDLPLKARPMLDDAGEWKTWEKKGDPVLHIELRKWADMLVVAPLTANTLAKMAQGLCDNLLTSVFRAWDFSKPVVVAPAMNTLMWDNNFTAIHIESLQKMAIKVIPPSTKLLACGDEGKGAMESPANIAKVCKKYVQP